MSLSKEQDLVNVQLEVNRAMWAINSNEFENEPQERDNYIYDCIGGAMKDLKSARRRYGQVVRRYKNKLTK